MAPKTHLEPLQPGRTRTRRMPRKPGVAEAGLSATLRALQLTSTPPRCVHLSLPFVALFSARAAMVERMLKLLTGSAARACSPVPVFGHSASRRRSTATGASMIVRTPVCRARPTLAGTARTTPGRPDLSTFPRFPLTATHRTPLAKGLHFTPPKKTPIRALSEWPWAVGSVSMAPAKGVIGGGLADVVNEIDYLNGDRLPAAPRRRRPTMTSSERKIRSSRRASGDKENDSIGKNGLPALTFVWPEASCEEADEFVLPLPMTRHRSTS